MYTRHGHHINGTLKTYPEPQNKARCGGPGICGDCNADQVKALVGAEDIYPDYPVIGPECFTNMDHTVISWKGQEYVKTCGEFVRNLPGGGQAFCTLTYDHPGNRHINTHLEEPQNDEGLLGHALRELKLLGEDEDIIQWYLDVVRAFVAYGHSGGSMEATLPVLDKLLRHEHLSVLTDDPDEWYHHSAEMWDGKNGIWQNKRNTSMFSKDQGKTYFNVNKPDQGTRHAHPHQTVSRSRPRSESFG